MTTALITGITGQDGSYLTELLLAKGYHVHGLVRRSSVLTRSRIDHLHGSDRLTLHYGDLTDDGSLVRLVEAVRPEEVYHLGGMSHVGVSFEMPEYTAATNAGGTRLLLRAIRETGLDSRFYQASSSEVFGSAAGSLDETAPYHPRNPYGDSKLEAQLEVGKARELHGMYAVCGIAFNHESPRRGENFVTRKITLGVASIEAGLQDTLTLGSLDAVRDWGYAPEYVEGMWLALQADEPTDYVLATGEGHSVEDFLDAAFAHAGMDWRDRVAFDDSFVRPTEVSRMVGSPAKAERLLGWTAPTRALELAGLMVDADREQVRRLLAGQAATRLPSRPSSARGDR